MASANSDLISQARMPIEINSAFVGLTFALAIITFAARCYLRIFTLRRFAIEDALLILAAICLVAAISLYFLDLENLYKTIVANLIPSITSSSPYSQDHNFAQRRNASATLLWVTTSSTKLAFLLFFRKLLGGRNWLRFYWWSVIVLVVLSLLACYGMTYATCSATFGVEVIESCDELTSDNQQATIVYVTTALDVLTYLLIASLSVVFLWSIHKNTLQKAGLWITVSQLTIMSIMAIARAVGARLPSQHIDTVWLAFWKQSECSLLLTVFSILTFHSFFITTLARRPGGRHHPMLRHWVKRFVRSSSCGAISDLEQEHKLNQAEPPSTMPMRTPKSLAEDVLPTRSRPDRWDVEGIKDADGADEDLIAPPVPEKSFARLNLKDYRLQQHCFGLNGAGHASSGGMEFERTNYTHESFV